MRAVTVNIEVNPYNLGDPNNQHEKLGASTLMQSTQPVPTMCVEVQPTLSAGEGSATRNWDNAYADKFAQSFPVNLFESGAIDTDDGLHLSLYMRKQIDNPCFNPNAPHLDRLGHMFIPMNDVIAGKPISSRFLTPLHTATNYAFRLTFPNGPLTGINLRQRPLLGKNSGGSKRASFPRPSTELRVMMGDVPWARHADVLKEMYSGAGADDTNWVKMFMHQNVGVDPAFVRQRIEMACAFHDTTPKAVEDTLNEFFALNATTSLLHRSDAQAHPKLGINQQSKKSLLERMKTAVAVYRKMISENEIITYVQDVAATAYIDPVSKREKVAWQPCEKEALACQTMMQDCETLTGMATALHTAITKADEHTLTEAGPAARQLARLGKQIHVIAIFCAAKTGHVAMDKDLDKTVTKALATSNGHVRLTIDNFLREEVAGHCCALMAPTMRTLDAHLVSKTTGEKLFTSAASGRSITRVRQKMHALRTTQHHGDSDCSSESSSDDSDDELDNEAQLFPELQNAVLQISPARDVNNAYPQLAACDVTALIEMTAPCTGRPDSVHNLAADLFRKTLRAMANSLESNPAARADFSKCVENLHALSPMHVAPEPVVNSMDPRYKNDEGFMLYAGVGFENNVCLLGTTAENGSDFQAGPSSGEIFGMTDRVPTLLRLNPSTAADLESVGSNAVPRRQRFMFRGNTRPPPDRIGWLDALAQTVNGNDAPNFVPERTTWAYPDYVAFSKAGTPIAKSFVSVAKNLSALQIMLLPAYNDNYMLVFRMALKEETIKKSLHLSTFHQASQTRMSNARHTTHAALMNCVKEHIKHGLSEMRFTRNTPLQVHAEQLYKTDQALQNLVDSVLQAHANLNAHLSASLPTHVLPPSKLLADGAVGDSAPSKKQMKQQKQPPQQQQQQQKQQSTKAPRASAEKAQTEDGLASSLQARVEARLRAELESLMS